jgi:hypothetical protein
MGIYVDKNTEAKFATSKKATDITQPYLSLSRET